jgi:hypothetical protein
MTNDQARKLLARKLLGGYATNSLTEAERKALFEAALDDQDLFDALQQEEALKELLADPISRNQIRQALVVPQVSRAAPWWSRGWPWVGAAGAVAAAVLIVAVIRSNPQPGYQVARVAPPAPVSVEPSKPAIITPAQPKPRLKKLPSPPPKAPEAENALRQPPTAGLPPPPPPAQPTPAGAAVRGELDTGAVARTGGFATNFKAPLLQYSLVKRDETGAYSAPSAPSQPGDAVRLNVHPTVGGYLSLYQLDPAGDWKRLFPAAEQGLFVAPNATQTIPDSPIIVTDMEQKFRLTLVGADTITVDITVGPGRVP